MCFNYTFLYMDNWRSCKTNGDGSMKLIILCVLILLGGCGKSTSTQKDNHYLERKAADKERFEKGAYIAKEKQLSPTESLRLVIIPGKIGGDLFDTKCLIYTNTQYKTAQMQCPDTTNQDFEE